MEAAVELQTPRTAQWKRISELYPQTNTMFAETGAHPRGIVQGSLGNLWFLGALAMVATRWDLLEQLILPCHPDRALYEFRFFKRDSWVTVLVDDYLPVTAHGEVLFGRCAAPDEVWVALLEKAYAKLHGHYQCLQSGSVLYALSDLTSGVAEDINMGTDRGKQLLQAGVLLSKLRQAKAEGWLSGCSFPPGKKLGRDTVAELGLIPCHIYPILDIRQIPGGIWLLRLFNPWGLVEWRGPWSDGSKEWAPESLTALTYQFSADGTFWMSLEDWQRLVGHFYICRTYRNPVVGHWWAATHSGEWQGESPISLQNPQYVLSCEEDTAVCVTVAQPDTMYEHRNCTSATGDSISLWALKCESGERLEASSIYKSVLAAPASPFVRERCVAKDIHLAAGRPCILVPATSRPVKGPYHLTVHSPIPILLRAHTSQEVSCVPMPVAEVTLKAGLRPDESFRGQAFDLPLEELKQDEMAQVVEEWGDLDEGGAMHAINRHKREVIGTLMQRVVPAVQYITDPVNLNWIQTTLQQVDQRMCHLIGDKAMMRIHQQAEREKSSALLPVDRTSTTATAASLADISGTLIFDDEIRALFDTFDKDGTGWLSKTEFKEIYKSMDLLGKADPSSSIDAVLAKYNMLGDDKISYEEFALIMLSLARK
eukprot:NODE_514_length_2130_cov_29.877683_g475_i0.p1 GENE.NODE_514_length_2130_cov_29.877683_g475_i0~~NODE_514_length_2130_cov_29.877683_g475_i0.p1  ORF type:complete len:697 (+),score=158.64 NODE_514_length_2130_cov_29.877683_g475_i0:133-2091(+)